MVCNTCLSKADVSVAVAVAVASHMVNVSVLGYFTYQHRQVLRPHSHMCCCTHNDLCSLASVAVAIQ